ncbi:MAG: polysaccharide deacetylase family protein [Bernardetiaceae bacterium]|nr:polysaccharide deacetylase family protein [Bernardetiaceae bacterium]
MELYRHKSGRLFRQLFPRFLWFKPKNHSKIVYLTFDDGPTAGVTDFVLDTLAQYDAQATFFCIGKNIREEPRIFERIWQQGHRIGNHTENHLNGWRSTTSLYLKNVIRCKEAIQTYYPEIQNQKKLFRPPYGRLKRQQANVILKQYQIVMWDVLTGDFDRNLQPQACLQNTIKHSESGSIVVFHDSLKAEKNLRYTLPRYLDFLQSEGYETALL